MSPPELIEAAAKLPAPVPDFTALQQALKDHDAAHQRLVAARAAVAAAEAEVKAVAAKIASGQGDPLEVAREERDAHDRQRMAARFLAIAEEAVRNAAARQIAAEGEAYAPVHEEGRRQRVAAARRADAARAELEAAETDFRAGTALVLQARNKGHKATEGIDGSRFARPVWTEAQERRFWEEHA